MTGMPRFLPAAGPLLLVGVLTGCGDKIPTPWSKTEGRQEVVVDPSSGHQTTTSTASDAVQPASVQAANAAVDASAPEEMDCNAELPTPQGQALGTLECGSTVTGSSHVGAARWGDDFYQRAFCTPKRSRYDDAPEVLYRLEVPENTQAEVVLESPCADLDVVAVAWQLDGVPGVEHVGRIRECEMDTKSGGGKLTLTTVDKAQVFLVGVDGKDGDEGNYRLTVSCGTFR